MFFKLLYWSIVQISVIILNYTILLCHPVEPISTDFLTFELQDTLSMKEFVIEPTLIFSLVFIDRFAIYFISFNKVSSILSYKLLKIIATMIVNFNFAVKESINPIPTYLIITIINNFIEFIFFLFLLLIILVVVFFLSIIFPLLFSHGDTFIRISLILGIVCIMKELIIGHDTFALYYFG